MSVAPALTLLLTVSACAGGCATASRGDYTTTWSRPDDIKSVQLPNGFALRYVSAGSGPPLVLLHTIRTQLDYFRTVAPALESHYRVYAVDLPGHGQSSILKTDYTEELFRKSVRDFITTLDLRDVTLVGESIGGVLALTVASELPERVSRVVAINPYDYGEKFGGGIRRGNASWIIGFFNAFGAHTPESRGLLTKVFKSGVHDPSKLDDALVEELYLTGKRRGYRRMEYSTFKHWHSWVDARALYPRVSVPVTLVYSSDDWTRPEDRQRNQQAIGSARLVTLDKTGHWASFENPDGVVRVILQDAAPEAAKASR